MVLTSTISLILDMVFGHQIADGMMFTHNFRLPLYILTDYLKYFLYSLYIGFPCRSSTLTSDIGRIEQFTVNAHSVWSALRVRVRADMVILHIESILQERNNDSAERRSLPSRMPVCAASSVPMTTRARSLLMRRRSVRSLGNRAPCLRSHRHPVRPSAARPGLPALFFSLSSGFFCSASVSLFFFSGGAVSGTAECEPAHTVPPRSPHRSRRRLQ